MTCVIVHNNIAIWSLLRTAVHVITCISVQRTWQHDSLTTIKDSCTDQHDNMTIWTLLRTTVNGMTCVTVQNSMLTWQSEHCKGQLYVGSHEQQSIWSLQSIEDTSIDKGLMVVDNTIVTVRDRIPYIFYCAIRHDGCTVLTNDKQPPIYKWQPTAGYFEVSSIVRTLRKLRDLSGERWQCVFPIRQQMGTISSYFERQGQFLSSLVIGRLSTESVFRIIL